MQTGETADGAPESRCIGYEIEDDFGNGNKTTRLKLCLDVLNPVLYQLVKPFLPPKSGHVVAVRRDFAKRYKDTGPPPVEEVAEANEQGGGA